MKNIKENWVLIIGIIIILGTHLVSCEKVPIPPVVVELELMPKLELSVTPDGEIPYGDVATLKWKTINALRVFVDGERQEAYKEGNKGTGNLFKTTTFEVKAVNVKLSTTEMVTIKVGPWWKSTFGKVSYLPWRYKAISISSLDGKTLKYWIPDPEFFTWVYYYHRDGRLTYSSNLSSNIDSWFLQDDNTILMNGDPFKLQVSEKEMVLSYQTTWNGQQVWYNLIFEHASDVPTDSD
jgi:hypothetical protein